MRLPEKFINKINGLNYFTYICIHEFVFVCVCLMSTYIETVNMLNTQRHDLYTQRNVKDSINICFTVPYPCMSFVTNESLSILVHS